MPDISIIMPVYNAGIYLDESITSILNQTFRHFELICVDDCSDDGETKKKLVKYEESDKRISVIWVKKNSGAANGRNLGLEQASGKYVQFLDADDVFDETMLEEMYNAIEKNNADVCVCAHRTFLNGKKDEGTVSYPREVKGITERVFSLKDVGEDGLCLWWDVPWNKLVKRKLLEKHHIQFQSLKSFNDGYYANMVILKAEKIVYTYTKKPFVFYRYGDHKQVSSDADILNFYYFIKKIVNDCWLHADFREKKQILFLISEGAINYLRSSKDIVKNEQLYNLIRCELLEILDDELVYSMSERVLKHIQHFVAYEYDERWNG